MVAVNRLITNILHNIFFCVQQKEESQLEAEKITFWVNYPFKEVVHF